MKLPAGLLSTALALLLTASFSAGTSAAPRVAPGAEPLQGRWEGKGPGGACAVTISGDSLHFRADSGFWYQTRITLPEGADWPQLHATILEDSTGRQRDIGTVVVALFKLEGETLTLGVLGSFEEPPEGAVEGGWELTTDQYVLEKAQSSENEAT